MSDRTVHAHSVLEEIVRYDRSGKWYIEDKRNGNRRRVGVAEAARTAHHNGFIVFPGLPGGRAFDRWAKDLSEGWLA